MKKFFLFAAVITAITQFSHAQEQNKFRIGLDIGYAMSDDGDGILVALEPKYNITNNMNVGFRIENTIFVKEVNLTDEVIKTDIIGGLSFMGTFDYYLTKNDTKFSPFMGIGIGYTALTDVRFEFVGDETIPDTQVNGKIGGLIRTGIELGKLRLAVTYNLIGKSEFEDEGDKLEVKNSYIGISLGFYVGGGKWKN